MFDLNENEIRTIERLLQKQARHRRFRSRVAGFVPEPGRKNADACAADYLEGLLAKLANRHG